MGEIRLKPCPFCGREVFSEFKHIGRNCSTEIYDLRVRCNNSECGLEKHHKIELDDESFDNLLKEIKLAVNDWNRRVGKRYVDWIEDPDQKLERCPIKPLSD